MTNDACLLIGHIRSFKFSGMTNQYFIVARHSHHLSPSNMVSREVMLYSFGCYMHMYYNMY